MGFRTVVIKNRCKLDLQLNGLEQFLEKGEIEQLIKQATYNDINVLLISPFDKYSLSIPTVVIDKDMCEIHKNIQTED